MKLQDWARELWQGADSTINTHRPHSKVAVGVAPIDRNYTVRIRHQGDTSWTVPPTQIASDAIVPFLQWAMVRVGIQSVAAEFHYPTMDRHNRYLLVPSQAPSTESARNETSRRMQQQMNCIRVATATGLPEDICQHLLGKVQGSQVVRSIWLAHLLLDETGGDLNKARSRMNVLWKLTNIQLRAELPTYLHELTKVDREHKENIGRDVRVCMRELNALTATV
ncbi:MAG TPA: hypothetical protein VFO38_01570 [Candidatus Saccharimonadales bacterium]|nr:hypothetical protein [Candidatus Saccharimonadales bacterium]